MSVLERQRYVDFYEYVDNVVYETRFRTARIVTQRKPCLKRQNQTKKRENKAYLNSVDDGITIRRVKVWIQVPVI